MINDIKLTSAMRKSLLNHQQIKDLTATVEKRLATGKKVNDILDGPVEYFKAKGLYDKADGLLKRKDDIDQGISVLKGAQNGLSSGRMIIEQVKGLAEEARNASAAQRVILEAKANDLLTEYNSLLQDTTVNGTNLLIDAIGSTNFDGANDRVDFGSPANLQFGGGDPFSISVWLEADSTSSMDVLTYASASTGFRGISLRVGTDDTLLYFSNGARTSTWGTNSNTTDYSTRSHLTVTYDPTNPDGAGRGEVKMYYNGSEVTVDITSGSLYTVHGISYAGLEFQVAEDIFQNQFDGEIGDLAVYSKTLNAAEITSLYNGNHITDSQEFYAPMNEGQGSTVYDLSGNANHGTIVNATIPTPFWDTTTDPIAEGVDQDLVVDLSEDTAYTVQSVDMRNTSIGLAYADFSATNIEATIASIDSALDQIDTTAASFATDFATLQTRLEFTEDLINANEEAADKLTLADLEEESANRLALQTREQLSVFSMTSSHRSLQNIVDILFGGGS